MTEKMRAAVLEKPGKIEVKQVPVPEVGDNEVLIKVKLCGICGTDLKIYSGEYAKEYLPFIPGHEFWGIVYKLGKNVKNLKVGERVSVDICRTCNTCYFCRRGQHLLCQSFTQLGIHSNGAFAEYVKAPWENCYKIPDSVDDYSAAFIEPMTAVIESAKRMNCEIASSVAIIGCGLGILHAAMAKLRGAAPVIIIGRNKKRMDIAKKMEVADYYINPLDKHLDPVREVLKLTNNIGADYVVEAVGTVSTYEQAFKMLRRGGVLEAFGVVGKGKTARFEPFEFVLGEKKVLGSCAGIGIDWAHAIRLLEHKRIDPTPLFSQVIPLNEIEIGLNELKNNKNIVKMFVSPEIDKRVIIND
jgi:threonine dehydrogenase-like Zn-dependent dehydrogenase